MYPVVCSYVRPTYHLAFQVTVPCRLSTSPVETCKWADTFVIHNTGKGKAVPLQAWLGPVCTRKLKFPDFMTTAQGGGKVVSVTHRPHLHPGNSPGTHFCLRMSRHQGHSAIGKIMSMKNSNDYSNESNQRPSDL